MQSSSRHPAGSSLTKHRRGGDFGSYGRGLPALSMATVVAIALALALVFFYAPLEAEQGFLQKIFYLHVPLAIIALCGFVLGGVFGALHLRTRDSRWDMRSYVTIHMSLIFGVGTLVAALAVRTRARDLLGPLLALPLLVPIVIGGARATAPMFTLTHATGPPGRWLLTLGLYDLVFGLIAFALFDFLLED